MICPATIILISLIALAIYYKKKYGRRDYLLKQFPSPKGIPLLGHIHWFFNKTPSEVFYLTLEFEKIFDKIYYLSFGAFEDQFIFVKDAKIGNVQKDF